MNFTGPTTRYGVPPARPTSTSLAKFASETPRADFRERVAICMFDGNLAEADAVHHCAVGSPPAAIDGRQCQKFAPHDDTQRAFTFGGQCWQELKRI